MSAIAAPQLLLLTQGMAGLGAGREEKDPWVCPKLVEQGSLHLDGLGICDQGTTLIWGPFFYLHTQVPRERERERERARKRERDRDRWKQGTAAQGV